MKPAIEFDSALLPRDPATGQPLEPRMQPGYYPGYSVLSQQAYWDPATRKVVIERVEKTSELHYFSPDQERFWRAVFDHLIPQHDRVPERQIPIVPVLDQRLARGETRGYRFADMPHDREAYLWGQEAIEQEAQARFRGEFISLPYLQQDLALEAIHDGEPLAAQSIWRRMSVHRFWMQVMQDAIEAYYAHPWAWDEIGFGGPAYPRAYMRLEHGEPEPWEVRERRYAWAASPHTISDTCETTDDFHIESLQHRSHGAKRKRTG